jgi:hypothetical protein
MLGIAATSLAASKASAAVLIWAMPIGVSAASVDVIFGGPLSRAFRGMGGLARAAARVR